MAFEPTGVEASRLAGGGRGVLDRVGGQGAVSQSLKSAAQARPRGRRRSEPQTEQAVGGNRRDATS